MSGNRVYKKCSVISSMTIVNFFYRCFLLLLFAIVKFLLIVDLFCYSKVLLL